MALFSCKASNQASKTDQVDDPDGQVISSADVIMVDKRLKDMLESYFDMFSEMDQEDTATRDAKMAEVFEYFNSPDTPVFLVLYNREGKRYYDKPMTITDYIYYLNDTRQAPHTIRTLKLDETQTKIMRVELAVKQ
ncbi:hypothetical protein C900_05586 [Fulvivirga imtechensis AK7]|uniref:Uncharacterized protein n=2 Tax=Fulvivirga TaxID=396811 RepID=L8JKZ7_9BACT|nr:hypothetical protein C900_05586 [Fulvivirga imtechensis AK7]